MANRQSRDERSSPSSHRPDTEGTSPLSAEEGGHALLPEEASVTIHPRITAEEQRSGALLARQRRKKQNTFWSEVVTNGLPLIAALSEPDKDGMYGPWTGEQLARKLRMLVAQLIEFQVQHGETPGSLLLLQQVQAASPSVQVADRTRSEAMQEEHATECFEAVINQATVEDITSQGFGRLRFLNNEG